MTNRICFLDYDGVLNNPEYLKTLPLKHNLHKELDPKRIILLKNLCSSTNAKIVLTSTWRDDFQTRKYLKQDWKLPILGATPHCHDNRSLEIHQWILNAKFDWEYIIIDDESSDLDRTQLEHLIYTREGSNLGLQEKHLVFAQALFNQQTSSEWADENTITAILVYIEEELCRIMENISQEDYDDPFQNSGNVAGFKTETFEVHAYDWGNENQPYNFKWGDFEVSWYKHVRRGLECNRPITNNELNLMLEQCLESLYNYEKENDDVFDF